MMKRQILAATVIAGMTFGGTPAVAGPDAEDIAKTLVGVAAAALLLKGVSDHRAKEKAETKTSGHTLAERIGSGKETVRQPEADTKIISGRVRPYEQGWRPGDGHGYKKKPLPASCRVLIDTEQGTRVAYSSRCLDRSFRHAKRLPSKCEALVRDYDRRLTAVYGARCLARDGWQVAHR